MTGARPSGSRNPKRAQDCSTPVQRASSCIPTRHEKEPRSETAEDTIVVKPIPKSYASAAHSLESLYQYSQSRMAGMEPSKQHTSPAAHNGLAKSPSQERKRPKIILRTPNGKADTKQSIAPQQEKAASRTEKLDTPMQECMKKPTTDKLTGIAYGTISGTKHALPSLHKPSQKNVSVIRNQTLSNIQPKREPVYLTSQIARPYMHPFPECLPSWHCQPDLVPPGNHIQPVPFLGATAGSASHNLHYLSHEQFPPQGIIKSAEQPSTLQEHFNHHETPASGSVKDADIDSLYEAGAQPKLIKVKYFPSCERCRILREECNGDSPCNSCNNLGEECDYKLESQGDSAEVEKWRFFEACNRCQEMKAKLDKEKAEREKEKANRDAQDPGDEQGHTDHYKPCDGQYPCGSCIDSSARCIYSIEPELVIDSVTENIAPYFSHALIAAAWRPSSRVKQRITECYGGISKVLRYMKGKRRKD